MCLLQVLSKGNVLCFPEARQAEGEGGCGQPQDVGPLHQAVACSVVSTRCPGAAATAARKEAVQREGSDSKADLLMDEEHRGCDAQLPAMGLIDKAVEILGYDLRELCTEGESQPPYKRCSLGVLPAEANFQSTAFHIECCRSLSTVHT